MGSRVYDSCKCSMATLEPTTGERTTVAANAADPESCRISRTYLATAGQTHGAMVDVEAGMWVRRA